MLLENINNQDARKAQEIIFRIGASNKNLIDLVNNFLDFNRIDAGKMTYDFDKVELQSLIREFLPDFRFLAKIKNVDLSDEIFPDPIYVKGDKYKLSQVFCNLLDNAIKYTESGWVKISLKKEGEFALVTVFDSGVGMNENTRKNIFGKFTRADGNGKVSGFGLGLYIGKKIVEAHGGEIWGESEGEGKGSKFYIRLPIFIG